MSLRGIALDRVKGGYRVKQTPEFNLFVSQTIRDWQIIVVSRTNPFELVRHFVYWGTDLDTFIKCVLAAWNWDAEFGTTPEDYDAFIQTRGRASRVVTL